MEILSYLFSLSPGFGFNYYTPLFIYCGIVFVGSYGLDFYIKKHKNENRVLKSMFGSLPSKLRWLSIVTAFLVLTRYQNIPYFSMRAWLFISLLVAVYLTVKYLRLLIQKYPAEKAFYMKKRTHSEENSTKKVYSMKKKRK